MRQPRYSRPLVLIVPALVLGGCAPRINFNFSDFTGRFTLQRAPIDDNREVALVFTWFNKGAEREPGFLLVIGPRPSSIQEYRLNPPSSAEFPPMGIDLEKLEIRSDASRDHVWFTDPKSGVIFATLDRHTGEALLLPNPPPAWATPLGGEVLPSELKPATFERQNPG